MTETDTPQGEMEALAPCPFCGSTMRLSRGWKEEAEMLAAYLGHAPRHLDVAKVSLPSPSEGTSHDQP